MGVAAVDFVSRASHFRMYARTGIEEGVSSYTQISGSFRWSEGTRYRVECTLDTDAHTQVCQLLEGGEVRQTREYPIEFLSAEDLSTQLRVLIGDDAALDHDHLQPPIGWVFCDLSIIGRRCVVARGAPPARGARAWVTTQSTHYVLGPG